MSVRAILLLVLFAVLFAGCAKRARRLEVADIMPPNYSEKAMPESFLDAFGDLSYGPGFWSRCFDCDLDWQGLLDHLRLNKNMIGYRNTTDEWFGVWNIEPEVEKILHDTSRIYSSPDGGYHVFVFYLKAIRDMGATVGSGGDYVLVCGPDRIERYR